MIYQKWRPHLHPGIELVPVELAGRGRRMHERLYGDIDEAVEDVFRLIREKIVQYPYALFGHSLGSALCFELAGRIRKEGLPAPLHIFFSGRSAPHVPKKEKVYHLMNDEDFKEEILLLGATPPEVFELPELKQVFIPMLKNDLRLAETIPAALQVEPFETDITVFVGKDEDLTAEQCEGWKRYTKGAFHIHYFKGGHFFLLDETSLIVDFINKHLNT